MSNLYTIDFITVDIYRQVLTQPHHKTFETYSQAKSYCANYGYDIPVDNDNMQFQNYAGNTALIRRQVISS